MVWTAILLTALVSLIIKAAGPALLGNRRLPAGSRGVIALLAPALLAGLVVVDVFGPHWSALSWPVLAGLTTVMVARLLIRAPMLVAVLAGMATTALLRLVA
ncbi:MAG TPA: AzlD domain-containing protein [Actinoplanes sp.]